MILRRFMQHIKEQNWFAVGLDVIVVVGGILLATQVSVSIEKHKADSEMAVAMQNLTDEIASTTTISSQQSNWQKQVMQGLRYALDVLDGKEVDQENYEEIYFALTNANSPPVFVRKYETLYELQSTGRLKDIPNKELRSALREVLSFSKIDQHFYDQIVSSVDLSPFDADLVEYGLILNDGNSWGNYRVINVDWSKAKTSKEFRQRIITAHGVYSTIARQNDFQIALHEEVNRLANNIGYSSKESWFFNNSERIFRKDWNGEVETRE